MNDKRLACDLEHQQKLARDNKRITAQNNQMRAEIEKSQKQVKELQSFIKGTDEAARASLKSLLGDKYREDKSICFLLGLAEAICERKAGSK